MSFVSAFAAPLLAREQRRFIDEHPETIRRDKALREHWLNGVPMHWMSDWQLPAPLIVRAASGSSFVDVDGRTYADFCLGDTGAMFGHSPPAVANALKHQAAHGFTCMLPTDQTARAGELLAERFSLPCWQITQTATDANRAVLRWARALTDRKLILVFDGCYHGSLEDTLVRLDRGRVVTRPGQIGQVADFASYARVVEFNDLAALEAALADGQVACLLAEPVMTNAGMVLPEEGLWAEVRKLCTRHGTLLAIDETHTLSSGPRGHAHRLGLTPDFLIAGKAIAGGMPMAVYGFTAELANRMERLLETKPAGHSGMGTTLAANALATAALVACLQDVMTNEAYAHMLKHAATLADGLRERIAQRSLPWHVTTVGARSELVFTPTPARTARESLAAASPMLERLLHLYLLNRGVLVTPFHNMMLVSPVTPAGQVQALLDHFEEFLHELS
ncbi:transaminase [Steroidobacter agaridevorans]|uniref:transaminase n=1 Tax=Steroidobacter agaridevorans TaxID=2695856 RepID=UPI00137A2A01|nr:transaminase [Steroidobacter agaridevorans]